jgi:hypothetical protein
MRKVTAETIHTIKSRHNAGEAIIEIARSLKLSYSTVRDIVRDTYRSSPVEHKGEFFDFNNRCVITGFYFPAERDNRLRIIW